MTIVFQLCFTVCWEVPRKQKGLKVNGTYQLPRYVHYDDLLRKNREALSDVSKQICLEYRENKINVNASTADCRIKS
jgi:hypothetical protein